MVKLSTPPVYKTGTGTGPRFIDRLTTQTRNLSLQTCSRKHWS
jgi:hypothetical protein